MPSCAKCNRSLGKIEEYIFLRIGICLDENDQTIAGLPEKARGLFSFLADETDRRKLGRQQKNLLDILSGLSEYQPAQTFKGLGPKAGVRGNIAIRVSTKKLLVFVKKIVKGIEYVERGRLVDKGRIVETHIVHDVDKMDGYFATWEKLISGVKKKADLGPALDIEYGVDPKNYDLAIYHIRILNHFESWAWVYRPSIKRRIQMKIFNVKSLFSYIYSKLAKKK